MATSKHFLIFIPIHLWQLLKYRKMMKICKGKTLNSVSFACIFYKWIQPKLKISGNSNKSFTYGTPFPLRRFVKHDPLRESIIRTSYPGNISKHATMLTTMNVNGFQSLALGSCLPIPLQLRYQQRNGDYLFEGNGSKFYNGIEN